MKRKVMRNWFIALFILGIVIGFLIPFHLKDLAKKVQGPSLTAEVFDIPKRLGQLDQENEFFKYAFLAAAETGGVALIRLDDKIPLHAHPKENHFVYLVKGHVKGTVNGQQVEAWQGQLIAIPAGAQHSIERTGDSPVEMMVFSTPNYMPNDTQWIGNKEVQ